MRVRLGFPAGVATRRLRNLLPFEKAVRAALHRRRPAAVHSGRSVHRVLGKAVLLAHAAAPALLLLRSPAFAKHCILFRTADRTRLRSACSDCASASPPRALPPEPALAIWSALAPAVRVLSPLGIPDSAWGPSIRISEPRALRPSGTEYPFRADRKWHHPSDRHR